MTDARPFDILLKILLIGDMGVGKSCLLLRYSDDIFNAAHVSTIGVDFKIRTVVKDEKVIKLQIWDTAGQERFRTITQSYYKGAHGVIVVYDVTKRDSFSNLSTWFADVRESSEPDVCCLIVGNKCDLEKQRQVTREMGENFASEHGFPFVETSAKNAVNVETAFAQMVDEIFKKKFENSLANASVGDGAANAEQIVLGSTRPIKKKKKCCK